MKFIGLPLSFNCIDLTQLEVSVKAELVR